VSKKTVLIVDDAYFMRNLIKKTLKEAGYEVIGEAKDGKEGVRLYFELKPDVVTMDINMPHMSGIEATKEILSKDPNAKIIAVTGNNDENKKRQILEAGAKEYLQKPFQPAFLWSKLDKVLQENEEIEMEIIDEPSSKEETTKSSSVVIAEAIEDDFDNMEIEIMDKPDESKNITLVIENEEDSIEFPEEYQEIVEEEKERFKLSKENLERLENDDDVLDDDVLLEFENPPFIHPTNTEQETRKVSLPDMDEPVTQQTNMKTHKEPPSTFHPSQRMESIESPSLKPNHQDNLEKHPYTSSHKPKTTQETIVSAVEISKSKIPNRNIEEITIRPQTITTSSGGEINIRPPRGRILRPEKLDEYDNTEIEEPILNVSDEENYNNDKNKSLFTIVKKLFKK
jgi:DNA-binding NarL/FixJ family response regulator